LKRELEELRECRKKFSVTPAPAHIQWPLDRQSAAVPVNIAAWKPDGLDNDPMTPGSQASPTTSPLQPFTFLEIERRKKEACGRSGEPEPQGGVIHLQGQAPALLHVRWPQTLRGCEHGGQGYQPTQVIFYQQHSPTTQKDCRGNRAAGC